MTEHVHKWVVDSFPTEAKCVGYISEEYGEPCKAKLNAEQMEARINAAERLSSSLARRFAGYIDETTAARRFPALDVLKDILQEYAEVRVYGNIH